MGYKLTAPPQNDAQKQAGVVPLGAQPRWAAYLHALARQGVRSAPGGAKERHFCPPWAP